MITQKQLAEHWGCSQPRVAQLVKLGCPMNSLKAADNWKEKRGQKRAATNRKVAVEKKKGRPLKPLKRMKPSKSNDSLKDALDDAILIQNAAFEAYMFSRTAQDGNQSSRLSEHNKALDARLKAEKAYREEQEARKVLVNRSEITEKVRRCMDVVLRRLMKLPPEYGPQCNEADPLISTRILQKAVNEIVSSGQKALLDL